MFGFFGGPGGPGGGNFEANYRAAPVAFIDKPQAEDGDKVFLPASALDRLASLHIEYPMLFKVENATTGRFTHCGVLEFIAEEGCVYLPHWMMQNLLLQVGDIVKFRNVSLPKGSFVKLQPVTSDFLEISNPKAVLERALRSYSCLTKNDCFVINYNSKRYEIEVRETRPGEAISIIETDCQVDFDAPKDYVEPARVPRQAPPAPEPMQEDAASSAAGEAGEPEEPEGPKFTPFVGSGRRLDGKAASTSTAAPPSAIASTSRGAGASTSAAGPSSVPKPPGASAPSRKAGTYVSTGNRLLDKLERERLQGQGMVRPAAPQPEKKSGEDDKETEAAQETFKAFQGKGYTLK